MKKKFIKICRGIWNISFISFAIKAIHVIHAMELCLVFGSVLLFSFLPLVPVPHQPIEKN